MSYDIQVRLRYVLSGYGISVFLVGNPINLSIWPHLGEGHLDSRFAASFRSEQTTILRADYFVCLRGMLGLFIFSASPNHFDFVRIAESPADYISL